MNCSLWTEYLQCIGHLKVTQSILACKQVGRQNASKCHFCVEVFGPFHSESKCENRMWSSFPRRCSDSKSSVMSKEKDWDMSFVLLCIKVSILLYPFALLVSGLFSLKDLLPALAALDSKLCLQQLWCGKRMGSRSNNIGQKQFSKTTNPSPNKTREPQKVILATTTGGFRKDWADRKFRARSETCLHMFSQYMGQVDSPPVTLAAYFFCKNLEDPPTPHPTSKTDLGASTASTSAQLKISWNQSSPKPDRNEIESNTLSTLNTKWGTVGNGNMLKSDISHWVQNSFWILFLAQVLEFLLLFFSWYHLPCICNSLELESVILHGICYILAWSLCILHGICYIWPCSPSILHGICYVLALQPLICMVFATFWYFKRSCGFLESFFRVSFRVF